MHGRVIVFNSCAGALHFIIVFGVRACVDLYPFFALARVYAHELGNLLGRVRV